MLFIESGVVYSVFWVSRPCRRTLFVLLTVCKTFLVGGAISNLIVTYHHDWPIQTSKYLSTILTLKASCFIDLIVRSVQVLRSIRSC